MVIKRTQHKSQTLKRRIFQHFFHYVSSPFFTLLACKKRIGFRRLARWCVNPLDPHLFIRMNPLPTRQLCSITFTSMTPVSTSAFPLCIMIGELTEVRRACRNCKRKPVCVFTGMDRKQVLPSLARRYRRINLYRCNSSLIHRSFLLQLL